MKNIQIWNYFHLKQNKLWIFCLIDLKLIWKIRHSKQLYLGFPQQLLMWNIWKSKSNTHNLYRKETKVMMDGVKSVQIVL